MAYNDDLLKYARQKTERELNSAAEVYDEAVANGDHDQAVEALRHYRYYEKELADLGGTSGEQLSQREQQWLAARPGIASNPQRMKQLAQTAQSLMAAGYRRDTDAFYTAMEFKLNAEDTEVPALGSEELIDIFGKSAYAPDMKTEAGRNEMKDIYNKGWHELQRRKAAGDYK